MDGEYEEIFEGVGEESPGRCGSRELAAVVGDALEPERHGGARGLAQGAAKRIGQLETQCEAQFHDSLGDER
eukprot:9379719-Lingulodinium_polyedra.AAC.1